MSRSGQNFQAASDRINHTRGEPSSFSAGTYQDPNGWSGGNEAEGYNTSSGYTAGTSNRLEKVSSGSGNVFEALGRWSDAVKLMSANMDRSLLCDFFSNSETKMLTFSSYHEIEMLVQLFWRK